MKNKIKVSEATGTVLDYLVAKCEGLNPRFFTEKDAFYAELHQTLKRGDYVVVLRPNKRLTPLAKYNSYNDGVCWKDTFSPSTNWSQGGPIIERENITLIRANSQYIEGKCVPLWFAETDKWVGHNITTGYEGEYFDPCFMIDEAGGCYGSTPLIAAMRAFVTKKFGAEIEIPEELK